MDENKPYLCNRFERKARHKMLMNKGFWAYGVFLANNDV